MNTQKILFGTCDNQQIDLQKGDLQSLFDIGQLFLKCNGQKYSSINWMFICSSTAGKDYKTFEPNFKMFVFDDIIDLYAQAYTLYAAKEIYEFGYGGFSKDNATFIMKNQEKQQMMVQDIQKILDHVWQYACENKIK